MCFVKLIHFVQIFPRIFSGGPALYDTTSIYEKKNLLDPLIEHVIWRLFFR